jgi:two-component system, NtrC family, response regulator AtoC
MNSAGPTADAHMGHASTASMPLTLKSAFVAGVSPAMVTLESVVAEIAVTNLPILITGEIGTGKETFARRMHELSTRREAPLIRVACASMDARQFLDEAELNDNGAWAGGTIFFDEISELDAACQQKLLYALPDGDASLRNGCLSARVISTTSQNLEGAVRAGRFRSELFYRINGVCLRLPPLRERKEDILGLADCFLTKHSTQLGRSRPTLSARTRGALVNYSWPGNIRELENVVKRIVALNDESLAISELSQPGSDGRSAAAASPTCSLKVAARAASREAERELILKALARTRWNRKRAAQELQISYKSLLYKLKQIGLQESETN